MNYLHLLSILSLFLPSILCHKIDPSLHRERESDGAFAARGADHLAEGATHNDDFDHEAFLGSAKTAEEFDGLSPAEAKERLAVLLKKVDTNNDEQVNTHELVEWILNSFQMLSKEESLERFEEADEDENNSVTWGEHLKETYGITDPDNIELEHFTTSQYNSMMKEDRQLFDAADENNDGELNAEEFLAFSHPEEHEKTIPILVAHTLEVRDKNKDGLLDFQEFLQGQIAGSSSDSALIAEKERFDEDYDKNRDGVLDKVEIRHWMVPDNQDIAASEVRHLFASADENEDGILTFAEILNHHDVFVGSEVTDYGEHLNNIHMFQDEL